MAKQDDLNKLIGEWIWKGLIDLYLAFYVVEKFEENRFVLLQQGIEKLSKAYLIAHYSPNLLIITNKSERKKKSLEYAKKFGHSDFIAEINAHSKGELKNQLDKLSWLLPYQDKKRQGKGISLSGWEMIKLFEPGSLESRYPTDKHISEKFPIGEEISGNWEIRESHFPEDVTKVASKLIIKMLENDFGFIIPKAPFDSNITPQEWKIFLRYVGIDN